ncbi:methyl-accepting chemotaxis protein [Desulfococcaceae bacterium HSG9]|nr:methyl-accepting chemotaxis protein [Desulfococcaceae bacterium HSG9]
MKLTLKTKLIGLFILLGFVPFIGIGTYSYLTSSSSMKQAAFDQLTAIREIKSNQIEDYFEVMKGQLKTLKEDPYTRNALVEFDAAFDNAGKTTDSLEWKTLSAKYDGRMKKIMQNFGWNDLFLMHHDGDIVYTVAREADLGKQIPNSELRDSGLGKAFRAAQSKSAEEIVFADFEPYSPSGNKPAAFMMGQMRDENGDLKGYVALQISLDKINNIMQERHGMGESGETYLVGSDKRMRSDSFLDSVAHSVEASFAGTIKKNGVDTEAAREALAGKTDARILKDYCGNPVLSAFAPVDLLGSRWAILAEIDESEAFSAANRLRNAVLIFGSIVALIIVATGWFFAKSISKPLNAIINTISSSSTQIAATVTQQERTASQQASSVYETNTTMDELSRSSSQSSHQAEEASEAAQKALELVQDGTVTVDKTMQSMSDLKEKVSAIAEQILQLSEQTSQIGAITNLVSDIANQTNLLALNAAVEAARAGEHGKGFAVVAAEIRKLADESKKSAAKINTLVGDIQKATNSTVMVTEEGTKTVDAGIGLTQKTALVFDKVSTSIGSTSTNVQQITLNIRQQASAVQQVVAAMNTINTGANETASGLSQTKTGVELLHSVSNNLKALV